MYPLPFIYIKIQRFSRRNMLEKEENYIDDSTKKAQHIEMTCCAFYSRFCYLRTAPLLDEVTSFA